MRLLSAGVAGLGFGEGGVFVGSECQSAVVDRRARRFHDGADGLFVNADFGHEGIRGVPDFDARIGAALFVNLLQRMRQEAGCGEKFFFAFTERVEPIQLRPDGLNVGVTVERIGYLAEFGGYFFGEWHVGNAS